MHRTCLHWKTSSLLPRLPLCLSRWRSEPCGSQSEILVRSPAPAHPQHPQQPQRAAKALVRSYGLPVLLLALGPTASTQTLLVLSSRSFDETGREVSIHAGTCSLPVFMYHMSFGRRRPVTEWGAGLLLWRRSGERGNTLDRSWGRCCHPAYSSP